MEADTIENGKGIRIGDAGSKGLGLFATQNLSSRDILYTIYDPALIAISTAKLPHFCYNCYAGSKPATDNGYSLGQHQDAHLQICTGCRMAHFCGKTCQTDAWKCFHKYECKKFAKWTSRLGSPFPESTRAILRFVLQHYNDLLPDGVWNKVLSLESHIDHLEHSYSKQEWMVMRISAESIRAYTGTDISLNYVLRLTLILKLNAMALTTTSGESFGVFLDPIVSRMNHSCDGGNIVVHRPVHTNYTSWTLQRTPKRPMMILFPVRSISEGEELTITYIDREQGVHERREALENNYPILCECDRCERDVQALEVIEQKNPELIEDFESWSETVEEQKNTLAAAEASLQTRQSAIATLEKTVDSMKSKPGFSVDWSPYPQAVRELRLAYMSHPAAYHKALLCGLEEYFVIGPEVYPHPLDPSRTIQAIFLVELLGLLTDTFYSPDTEPERIKQREDIEKMGFAQTIFVYWYFRICKDMRGTLLQSAAVDLADVFLKLQMNVGMPIDVAEKLLRDTQVKSKAEEDMRKLLNITKKRWGEMIKTQAS